MDADFMMEEYLSPKLEARPLKAKRGCGIFALETVRSGELLAVWGGSVLTGGQLAKVPSDLWHLAAQVEEDIFIVSFNPKAHAPYINHSCEPNAGLRGQIAIVAMRDIAQGEEICIDYAVCDGSPYDEFDCSCGSAKCRKRVTGNDWAIPELWERYTGYFSPYLQMRIDQIRAHGDRIQPRPAIKAVKANGLNHEKLKE